MKIETYLQALASRKRHIENKVRLSKENEISPPTSGSEGNQNPMSMKDQIKFIKRLGRVPSLDMKPDPRTIVLSFYENEIKNSLIGYKGKDFHTLMTILQFLDLNSPDLMGKVADCLLKEAISVNPIIIIAKYLNIPNVDGTKDGNIIISPKWYTQVVSDSNINNVIDILKGTTEKLCIILRILNYMYLYGLSDSYSHISNVTLHIVKLLKLSLTVVSGFQVFKITNDEDIAKVINKTSPYIIMSTTKTKASRNNKKNKQGNKDNTQDNETLSIDQYHPLSIGSIEFIGKIDLIPASMEVLRYEKDTLFQVDSLHCYKYVVPAHLAHPGISIFPIVRKIIKITTIGHIEEFDKIISKSNNIDDYQGMFDNYFLKQLKNENNTNEYIQLISESSIFLNRYYRISEKIKFPHLERYCTLPTIPTSFSCIYDANRFKLSEPLSTFVRSFKAVLQSLSIIYSLIAIYNRYLVKRSDKLNMVLTYSKFSGRINNIAPIYRARQILLNAENEYIQNYLLLFLNLDGGFSGSSSDHNTILRMITSSPGDKFLFSIKSNNDIIHELFTIKRFKPIDPSESFYLSREDEDLYLHFKYDNINPSTNDNSASECIQRIFNDKSTNENDSMLYLDKDGHDKNNNNKNDEDFIIKKGLNNDVETIKEFKDGSEDVCSINAAEKQFNRSILKTIITEMENTNGNNREEFIRTLSIRLIQLLPTLSSIQEADEWLSFLVNYNNENKFDYNSEVLHFFLNIISHWNDYTVVHCLPYVMRILATLYWHDIERRLVENVIEVHSRRAYGYAKKSIELILEKNRNNRKDRTILSTLESEFISDNASIALEQKRIAACLFECCFFCEMAKFGLILPVQFMKYVEFCSRLKNVIVPISNTKIVSAFNTTLYRCLCVILTQCSYYILSLKAVGENSIKTILNTLNECPLRRSFEVDKESLIMQKDAILSFNISSDVYNDVHANRMNTDTVSLAKNLYQRILKKLIEKEDEIPIELRFLESLIDSMDRHSTIRLDNQTENEQQLEKERKESWLNKAKFVSFFAFEDWTNIDLYGDDKIDIDFNDLKNEHDNNNNNPQFNKSSNLRNNMDNDNVVIADLKQINHPVNNKRITITKIMETFFSSLISSKTIPIIAELLKDMIRGDVEKYVSDPILYSLDKEEAMNFDGFLAENIPFFKSNCKHAASAIIMAIVDTLWKFATHSKSAKDVIKPCSRVIQLSNLLVELGFKRNDSLKYFPVISHLGAANLVLGILCCGIGGFTHNVYINNQNGSDIFINMNAKKIENEHFLASYLPTSFDVLPTPAQKLITTKTRIICSGIILEGIFWNNINGSLDVPAEKTYKKIPKFSSAIVNQLRICFFLMSCLLWSFIRRKGYKRCSLYDGSGFVPMLQRLVNEFGDIKVEKQAKQGSGQGSTSQIVHRIWLPCNDDKRFTNIVNKLLDKEVEKFFSDSPILASHSSHSPTPQQTKKFSFSESSYSRITTSKLLYILTVLAKKAMESESSTISATEEERLTDTEVEKKMENNLVELTRPTPQLNVGLVKSQKKQNQKKEKANSSRASHKRNVKAKETETPKAPDPVNNDNQDPALEVKQPPKRRNKGNKVNSKSKTATSQSPSTSTAVAATPDPSADKAKPAKGTKGSSGQWHPRNRNAKKKAQNKV